MLHVKASPFITDLDPVCPNTVSSTQSSTEEEPALALEMAAEILHANDVRDTQDAVRIRPGGDLKYHEKQESGIMRIAEVGGVESSGAPVGSERPASGQPRESTVASSTTSPCISSLLPLLPAVVILAPLDGLLAPLEGAVTHQPSDDGPAVDRSAFQAACDRPSQISAEEDDSDSVPSDDNSDSDYPEDIGTEVLDPEKQSPPSKRRKLNQPLDADLSEPLGSDQGAPSPRSPSQHDHSRGPPSTGPSLESEPIPIQGFFTLQNCGSDVVYCFKFSQMHFASFFATAQTQEAPRQTRGKGILQGGFDSHGKRCAHHST